MPASDGGGRGAGRAFLWFVVVANAILGGIVLVLSVASLLGGADGWGLQGSLAGLVVGAGWVGLGALGVHRTYLATPPDDGRNVSLTSVDGAPAVVLRWRTTLLRFPVLTLLFLVAISAW